MLCFAGAQEGIACALQTLLEPTDHAIVVTPNYQAPESIALSICDVTGVPLDQSQGFALDIPAIEAAIRPNTRLIAVNFPNNPTGAVPDHATFAELVAADRRDTTSGCSPTRSTAASSRTPTARWCRPPTCRNGRSR